MKTTVILFLSLLVSIQLFSQSIIILKSGEKITAKKFYRLRPKDAMAKYKSADGTKKEVKKIDLFCMVSRRNILVFDDKGIQRLGKLLKNTPDMDPNNLCSQAIVDAIKNYKPTGAVVGTGVASFLVMPVGLVTAIIVSSTPPSESHLHMDKSKSSDAQYCDCYKKEASAKKKSSTWLAWADGWCYGIMMACIIIH